MPAPMKLHVWNDIPVEQLNDLVTRQVLHSDLITMSRLCLKKGAVVPRHQHVNEQITTLEKGRLRFIFDDEELVVQTGESLQIPSNVSHRVEALEDSVALDLFSPVREDWIRGDDAYLRR
jgi:quercetin dioxygenase-like cupin family protein